MKVYKVILPLIIFALFVFNAAAQQTPRSAQEEFDEYERNFHQVTKSKSTEKKPFSKPSSKPNAKSKAAAKSRITKTKSASGVGLPGLKIWLEKQTGCAGAFLLAAPSSVFKTGDCVRARFRLNFEGYLTIVNYGSSGSINKIFPLNNQENKIFPKTDNFIPDNRGWEFYNESGNENLFFVVSKLPLSDDIFREIQSKGNQKIENFRDLEVYDRDLKPRTEKSEIFVLAAEERLEKPLIFRLTLKHR